MLNNKHRDEAALHEFYSIALAKNLSFIDKASQVLQLGCEYLGLQCGIISYVEKDRYTILHTHTTSDKYQIQGGDVFELGLTYCKFTLDQKEPVGFSHAAKTEIAKHPSYELLKLEAYLGAPLFLNNNPFGTVNFTSIEPRTSEFTDSEKYYIELIAEWISSQLENQFIQGRKYESHNSLSTRLENSPLALIEWTPEYKVYRWSENASNMLGWREEQVLGKPLSEWPLTSQKDKAVLDQLQIKLKSSKDEDCAFYSNLITSTGLLISTEWFVSEVKQDATGTQFIQTQILDITEHIHAEEELLKKSARYIDLYENAPDMYISIDQVGNIISANKLCYQMLGYQKEELLGKSYWNLILKEDNRRIRRLIDVAFLGDVEELDMEAALRTKDDDVLNTHQRIRIIQAKQGMPRELRILVRDITERKREQIQSLEHIKNQRDEISLEIQHRIKNSLQAVIGLLTVNIDANPELKPILTNSIAQVNAISIVNSLILHGRQNVILLKLVEDIIRACSRLYNFEVDLNIKDDAQLILIDDEVIAVSLIITELLTNALKYHGLNSNNENYVSAEIEISDKYANISVANSFNQSKSQSHEVSTNIGKSMIQSLLPPNGVGLKVLQNQTSYQVNLSLSEPVVIDESKLL